MPVHVSSLALPSLRSATLSFRLALICASLIPATLHAVNDFSGTGPNQPLPFLTTAAQWSLVSGAYQNRVTGINPGTAVVSSAALLHPDALPAATIVLKTRFTVDSFTTPPVAGTPTCGFGLFASTSTFNGNSPQSYYLADFAFADGVNLNNEGRLRILSLGAANADFTTTPGVADAAVDTVKVAVVPGTAYTLILTATRGVSGLALTLGLYAADGVTPTDTNADGDLEDPEDVKKIYRMRLTGHGWGSPGATWDVEITDANNPAFTRKVIGLQRYQTNSGSSAVPTALAFSTEFGNNPGFWVDDVSFVSTVPPAGSLAISAFRYSPAAALVEFSHSAPPGLAYRIQGTNDFTFWENLGDMLGTPAVQPFSESLPSPVPTRFYRLIPR